MSLKETMDGDIKQAMLAKKKGELLALRSIKSMILLAETEKGAVGVLTKETEMRLLAKAAKQRKESAELFSKEGRQDLADKENAEHEIIARYLPKSLTEGEVEKELVEIIASVGASSPTDIGKVMGVATKKMAGIADGSLIASLAKKLLTSS